MISTDFETALTYLRSGRPSDAFAILSRIVDRWPTFAAAQVAYARALQQLGQPEASFQAWSRAEALVSRSEVVKTGLLESAADLFAGEPGSGAAVTAAPPVEAPERPEPESEAAESSDLRDADEHLNAEDSTVAASEEMPEFTDSAVPTPPVTDAPPEESTSDASSEPEWIDGPVEAEEPLRRPDHPEWDGSYAGESGDGAGSDADLEEEPEADLDRLIDELETARIVPADDPSSIPPPDLSDDIDDVVSETLARIYATQNQFSEAARVYDRLALERPERAEEYRAKASEMRDRAR